MFQILIWINFKYIYGTLWLNNLDFFGCILIESTIYGTV
jgi:hypothetical protein